GTPGDRASAFAEAARLFEAGKLTIPVANAFALHQADKAHGVSEEGHVAGRTIIVVD
ncbi:MAG: NADPH:quinone reductase, partial [Pseudonocardiales bacterium]